MGMDMDNGMGMRFRKRKMRDTAALRAERSSTKRACRRCCNIEGTAVRRGKPVTALEINPDEVRLAPFKLVDKHRLGITRPPISPYTSYNPRGNSAPSTMSSGNLSHAREEGTTNGPFILHSGQVLTLEHRAHRVHIDASNTTIG